MMNQRSAVFAAVCAVLSQDFFSEPVTLTPDQKKQVYSLLQAQFESGQIELKGERDSTWIKAYVPGLVNNWLRKDPKLNGDTKYVTKNPGIRQGSGDEQMKAMKALLSVTTSEVDKATIQSAIDSRKAELAAAKVKPIDVSALPESLRHLVHAG